MIEIKRWDNGSVIHSGEFSSIKECLEDGIRKGVDFSHAKLNYAELNDAELNGAEFNDAKLNYARLNRSELNYAELNDAELNGAEFNDAKLNYARLNRSELNDAEFNGAEFNGAELNNAKLNDAEFSGKHCYISCGEEYRLFIHEQVVVVGCQTHSPEAWRNMTKEEIAEMDGKYYLKYYPRLLNLMDFFLGEGDRPEWAKEN